MRPGNTMITDINGPALLLVATMLAAVVMVLIATNVE